MSDSFHRVLFPGTCHVLGHALPPLSLLSLSVLQAVGSPFLCLSAETPFTLGDLQAAVRCAFTPTLQTPQLKPSLRDRVQHFRYANNVAFRHEHAAAFMAWLHAHQRLPALWQIESDSEPRFISAPLPLSQVAALMALGMTHVEAWSCSPGYAQWLILAHGERHSDSIRFADSDDETDIEAELDAIELQSESDILALAKSELPPAIFAQWLSARQQPSTTVNDRQPR